MSLLALPRSRGDSRVEAELRRRIRARGRVTFAEFMEVALYLPEGGYYEAHAGIGQRGDFLTSPETHPVFGALLARLGVALWRTLGRPRPFVVVEYGAGTGSQCRQFLGAAPRLDEEFAAALQYEIVEKSAFLRALQQAQLVGLLDQVIWRHPRRPPEPALGCVLANEVVDALPVNLLRSTQTGPREVYIGLAADRYLELTGPPSCPDLEAYLRDQGIKPPGGSAFEINLAAKEWLTDAASRLRSGYVITIDFGGAASQLYGCATARGGLKCFYRYGWSDDPLDRPGLQDIAAPVDFTNLARAGAPVGLAAVVEISQAELLAWLGLGTALRSLEQRPLPVAERERNRRAMETLADPAGLGAYRVLLQAKAAPTPSLDAVGEYGRGDWLPLLPEQPLPWPL